MPKRNDLIGKTITNIYKFVDAVVLKSSDNLYFQIDPNGSAEAYPEFSVIWGKTNLKNHEITEIAINTENGYKLQIRTEEGLFYLKYNDRNNIEYEGSKVSINYISEEFFNTLEVEELE